MDKQKDVVREFISVMQTDYFDDPMQLGEISNYGYEPDKEIIKNKDIIGAINHLIDFVDRLDTDTLDYLHFNDGYRQALKDLGLWD